MKRLIVALFFILAFTPGAWADGPTTMINLDHAAAEINQANATALAIRSANGIIISDGAGNILTAPTGALVPSGGTTGQILGKSSNADYDIGWIDQTGGGSGVDGVTGSDPITVDNTDPANPVVGITSGTTVPPGGTTGQVLKKASDNDYDAQWAADEGGTGGSPGGEQNSVQYNDGAGGFAGNANFKYDPATGVLDVGGVTSNAPDGEHFIGPVNTADKNSPNEGDMWYNATDKTYRYWDGSQLIDVPGAGGGGGVEGVTGTAPITVDNTDPANPVIGIDGSGYAPASHVSDSTVHVPAGGTTGQVLTKATDNDGDTNWTDLPAGGGGVEGVTGTAPVQVDNTDPANPIIGFDTTVYTPASHATQTDNPHSVTAAQVGAPTTADFTSHTGNTSNPHSVTASQVGAPASTQVGNIIISADCASETGVQYDLCFQTN